MRKLILRVIDIWKNRNKKIYCTSFKKNKLLLPSSKYLQQSSFDIQNFGYLFEIYENLYISIKVMIFKFFFKLADVIFIEY